jgi:hypothetical protein
VAPNRPDVEHHEIVRPRRTGPDRVVLALLVAANVEFHRPRIKPPDGRPRGAEHHPRTHVTKGFRDPAFIDPTPDRKPAARTTHGAHLHG